MNEKMNLLKKMMIIRKMEELAYELYTKEKIRGFLHLYIGEEAVATGVMEQLTPEDNVMSTYREHAHAYLKGISLQQIFSEMFGKVEGCSKGRGGSMHLFSKKHRFFGGSAIVAAGVPQAVGLAFAAKKLNEKRRTVCFFGEGAMSEGVFYEAINMAALWKIPILFCCENNLYAMGTHLKRSQAETNLGKKVSGFNILSESVDGMDVHAVYNKAKEALNYIEEQGRPYFLECQTYRFKPHSIFDPELYREKEEVIAWKKKCPIEKLKSHLFSENLLTLEIFKDLEHSIEKELFDSIQLAMNGKLETLEDFMKEINETNLS